MLLAWIDESSGTREARITQFVYQPGCYVGYAGNSSSLGAGQPGVNVSQIDLAAADVRAGLILSYGDTLDHDLKLFTNRGFSIIDQSTLCPAVPNASVQVNVAGQWTNIHTETDGDLTQPTIGVQLIDTRGQGQNETEVAVDIVFAWQRETDRVDQIDGGVIRIPFSGLPGPVRPLIPQYASDAAPRAAADNVSVNYGYAAHPELAVSYYGTFLAWIDDDVTFTGGDSNIFILSRYRDPDSVDYVMSEFQPQDASGQGISETGRSLQHISLGLDNEGFTSTDPYVVWTEAALTDGTAGDVPTDGVYLRVNQFGLTLVDDRSQGNKFQRQSIDVLSNDLNLFGELPGRIVKFDGRDVPETGTLQFVSPLGASVTVSAQGEVTYDPRGIQGFRRLRTGHSLTESFTYEVYNFIYRAEAIVTFQTNGLTSWSNLRNLLDVNDDGNITPLDALLIINQLNSVGPRSLFGRDPEDLPRFIDVNNDGYVTALDALLVINRLNQGGSSEGEQGESTGRVVSAADDFAEATGIGGSDISYQPYNRRRRLK
ncbi:MAG: dockerin type I domain-containing protein [Pirellulales bacterium]